MPRTIFLIDFETRGHHRMYADLIRGWLDQSGAAVQLALIERGHLEEIYRQGKVLSRIVFWQFLKDRLRPAPADLIFFLYWDDIKPFWLPESSRAWLLTNPIVGIWMNTWGFRTAGQIRVGWRSLGAYPFLKEKNLNLLILDEGVLPQLRSRVRADLAFLPDFTDEVPAQRTPLVEDLQRFRQGSKLCLMIGAILGNKNPRLFLDLAEAAIGLGWVFGIIGEVMVDWIVEEAAGLPNLKVWNGRIASDGEYNALVGEADLLWGVYHQWPGSSNLLTKAGLAGIPVVVAPGFLAAERVRLYQLGFVVGDDSTEDLLKVLKDWDDQDGPKPNRKFREDFSIGAAQKAVLSMVTQEHSPPRPSLGGRIRLAGYRLGQTFINVVKILLGKKKKS